MNALTDGGVRNLGLIVIVCSWVYSPLPVIDAGQENAREASGKLLTCLHISVVQILLLYWCSCIYCGCFFCREG